MNPRPTSFATRRPPGRRAIYTLFAAAIAASAAWFASSNSAKAAPGDLDPTFGVAADGKFIMGFGPETSGTASAVALYPGNKTVVAGMVMRRPFNTTFNFLLMRFNPDGTLDTQFGDGGIVETPFGHPSSSTSVAQAVAVQDDGKIVVAGYARIFPEGNNFALARYNPDGSLDPSFDGDGKVTTDFSGFNGEAMGLVEEGAVGLVIQPDQKIVAVGGTSVSGNCCNSAFALARYNVNGSLDPTFGGDGKVTTDFPGATEGASGVALQPDGRIVAVGNTNGCGGCVSDFALARYNSDGSLDPTFGGDGKVTTDVAAVDTADSVALQPDGRIVVGGSNRTDFVLLRYTAAGALDNTFDGDGVVTTDFDGRWDRIGDVLVFPDGKILAVGGGEQADRGAPPPVWELARYNADGSLDASFGSGGKVTTQMGSISKSPAAMDAVLQSDGKVVAAGSASSATNSESVGVARYLVAEAPASTVQFSAAGYEVGAEDCISKLVTVTRTGGDVAATSASVDFVTLDDHEVQKSDYTFTIGTVTFAPGETSKTFPVLWTEDSIQNELGGHARIALTNPVGVALGDPATALLSVTDDDGGDPKPNAIDDAANFVCQHYHDFLYRQADAGGQSFWTDQITECESRPEAERQGCREVRRINVSAAFFLSIEFQETGFFAVRVQRLAFGRRSDSANTRMTYVELVRDTRRLAAGVVVGEPGAVQKLEENKQIYAERVVNSPAFVLRFPTTQTAAEYVDALYASAGVTPTPAERQAAITAFGAGGTAGRVAALRQAAESQSLRSAELNAAFVLLQYHGYMRRNPTESPDTDDSGYQFWLGKLNGFGGNYINAEMVKAFITSGEYRGRFGP